MVSTGAGVVAAGVVDVGVVMTGAGDGMLVELHTAHVVSGDGATEEGIYVHTGEEVVAIEDQT